MITWNQNRLWRNKLLIKLVNNNVKNLTSILSCCNCPVSNIQMLLSLRNSQFWHSFNSTELILWEQSSNLLTFSTPMLKNLTFNVWAAANVKSVFKERSQNLFCEIIILTYFTTLLKYHLRTSNQLFNLVYELKHLSFVFNASFVQSVIPQPNVEKLSLCDITFDIVVN